MTRAQVSIGDQTIGSIGSGWVILLGVGHNDTPETARKLADKIAHLRCFADDNRRMNRSTLDAQAEMLVVSQFTLYADTDRGRRPSFVQAARPEIAEPLVNRFADELRALGLGVQTGRFGAMMDVELVNDGPVTIWLDTDDKRADDADA